MPQLPFFEVVRNFDEFESVLDSVLRVVPYCQEHFEVWSPKLATIMLDACAHLDSLWRAMAPPVAGKKQGDLTMADFAPAFAPEVAAKWVMFWGGESDQIIRPFGAWQTSAFNSPSWWSVHNKVKHDRLANRQQATLRTTIETLAGLFVAIESCSDAVTAMQQAGWVPKALPAIIWGTDRAMLAENDRPGRAIASYHVAVESRFFSRPVGWFDQEKRSGWNWTNEDGSPRVVHWFNNAEWPAGGP